MLTWSTNELADILEVSPSTIKSWVHRGHIKGVKTCNREGLRFSSRNLFEFFKAHQNYYDIFYQKLTTNSCIGEKLSHDVLQYLLKVGLIK